MKKQIAIVTSATGGLGKEFVKLLLEEDIDEIWAIARSREKLDTLKETYGNQIQIYPLDISDRNQYEFIKTKLKKENPQIKYLINNAGSARFCSYDDISIEDSLNMIDLNIGAAVAIGLECIPYMPEISYIINIA